MISHGLSNRGAGVIAPAFPGLGRAFIKPAVPVQDGARPIVAYPVALLDAEQTGAFAPIMTIVAQGQHGRISSHRRLAIPVCGSSAALPSHAVSSRPAGIAPTLPAGHPIQQTRAVPVSQRGNLAGAFGFRSFSFEG